MATTQIPNGLGWLPHDPDVMDKWLQDKVDKLPIYDRDKNNVITEFQNLIENDPEIYMGFNMMFEQTEDGRHKPQVRDIFSRILSPNEQFTIRKQIKTYQEMLTLFNELLHQAPDYANEKDWGGLVDFPFRAVINGPMVTPAGLALFTHHKVNAMLKKMFDVWAVFLTGKKSRYVLNKQTGWFCKDSLDKLKVPAFDDPTNPTKFIHFDKAYVCNPSDEHYGFGSWDNFFVREFAPGIRPVEDPSNDNVIVSACESDVYRIANNVKQMDTFWIKGQPYSLHHMLAGDPLYGAYFKGGIVYQAFLSGRSYHRWHAPVSGKVVKIVFVPGTYYATWPGPDKPDLVKSQPYITQVATRILVFIEAKNPKIGTMCFIAVGMSDVSTCQITIQENDLVTKGEEIGMFHYGGSTYCLVFRKEANLKFVYNGGQLPYNPDPKHPPHACLSRKIVDVL
jgi:phosphatidylserine decarboxylase